LVFGIAGMVKNLQLTKNISWGFAAITMFFLILGNKQNNILSATAFVLIILGIIFSYLQDKMAKK
jgi:hypothetical protein